MRISTPTEIEQVAWEGALEPLGETFKAAPPRPRVTLGEPVWWPAEIQALGRALNRVLSGDRDPDLSALPPELAAAVRRLLEAI